MRSLGINIGSSSIKAVMLEDKQILWKQIVAHEGNFIEALKHILQEQHLPAGLLSLVTGTEGRYLLNMNNVLESICIEEALARLDLSVDAVVSLGGENFVVYTINEGGRIITSFSGNKCASGTGEFFKQQLGRMDLRLVDVQHLPESAQVCHMSSRCSVFMKSDCTHKLNKGEATKADIVLSLTDVMATKVSDFLKRARIKSGRVLLAGGVSRNKYIIQFVKDKLPDIEFIVPEVASYLEAFGAAFLAQTSGSPLPPMDRLIKSQEIDFARYESLETAASRVTYLQSKRGTAKTGREYILGVDGGSTTTKVALIDIETDEIVASYYGRTHGDPVNALRECLVEVKKQLKEQIGDAKISITLASTTGSSREILGVFLETPAVYNEIIAHAVGTTYFKPDIDTIFEIGGQDAKYALLKNRVPIDYAMNEACSAGTGSFLEESASGDLNITNVRDIGDIAVRAQGPLKFGEQCSAFINSDIRKAIQLGASREDITAGIITSIVSNYLNRVVGNRTIGDNIVLQGGVALNKAVPLAFAMLMDKDITIPPDPELLGCFGVGILARQKFEDGLIEKRIFDIDEILATKIIYEREFRCKACENECPVRVLNVNGHRYMFGGRCNKYANLRKKNTIDESNVFNYIEKRERLMFHECAPKKEDFVKKRDFVVGIPKAFSVYTLWPLYSWFFHSLGVEVRLSEKISHDGVARTEGSYCFPAEIAHGAVQDNLNSELDYIFVPHFRDLESYVDDVHANFCPITQSLPYYIMKAFPEIDERKFLAPIVSFKFGMEKALEGFICMGEQLGITEREVRQAFDIGCEKQEEFWDRYRQMGQEAFSRAAAANHPVIAILGRPYNAFTRDANMGIPLKFTTRGYSVIPFDMLPFEQAHIFDNMYWYYGQQDMMASVLLKDEPNIFITYITNFSCAPDSFMLHYVKWIMGTKPFLVLELDSHSADAGIDTRVEAFLDIIEGYRSKIDLIREERYDNGLRFINNGVDPLHLMDIRHNRRIEIFGNKRVIMLLSNMGRLSTELLAASVRVTGINAEAMPLPDIYTLQMARNHMSGKECLPSQLVLGSALSYFSSDKYKKEEIYLLFVPTTTGPCRTGQYFVFYENLFKDMRLENVVVITMDSDNSYNELGPDFSKSAWWGLMVADYMKDVETSLRTCAVDPVTAIAKYDELWQELIEITETDRDQVLPTLKRIAAEIAKIPLKRKVEETPKVLIVGEIYVRRDDFAVDELIRMFSKRGIIAKVSGITEWIYYCDYTRKHDIQKRLGLLPWFKKPFSRELRDLVYWKLEEAFKHRVDTKIKKALAVTGLVPRTPHDMEQIMANAQEHFVSDELYSEITISSGVASTAMMEDYSGIVNISPFACLIGRVIEGLITPWSRERRFPVISVEIDGDILPPGIVNKLEIFMLNVLRFRYKPDVSDLVEREGDETVTLDRKIIKA
ncbi:MAG: activase [Spirochaetes bacterium RBG_13_51_14]|nr:MAG: activase [Spirochaetes bacterium RBG_13_51_14]